MSVLTYNNQHLNPATLLRAVTAAAKLGNVDLLLPRNAGGSWRGETGCRRSESFAADAPYYAEGLAEE